MRWIASNSGDASLNADPNKGFLMGGVSAGASLTGAFSRIFQDSPLAHPLTGLWLCVPSLAHSEIVPEKFKPYYLSNEQQAKNPFFSAESRKNLESLVEWDISSPMRYAFNSTNDLKHQPKTYFQVDGADPLRDDGLIYDEMLKEAGVETKMDFYPGCPHAHFQGFPGLEVTIRANIDTVVGFGWLLGKEISREAAAEALGF
jgi:acetyl esterase/lipase